MINKKPKRLAALLRNHRLLLIVSFPDGCHGPVEAMEDPPTRLFCSTMLECQATSRGSHRKKLSLTRSPGNSGVWVWKAGNVSRVQTALVSALQGDLI